MSLSGLMVIALVLMLSIPAAYADAQESSGAINLDGIQALNESGNEQLTIESMPNVIHSVTDIMVTNGTITVNSEGQVSPASSSPETVMNVIKETGTMDSVIRDIVQTIDLPNEVSQLAGNVTSSGTTTTPNPVATVHQKDS